MRSDARKARISLPVSQVRRAGLAPAFFLLLLAGCGGHHALTPAPEDVTAPRIRVVASEPALASGEVCGEWIEGRIIEADAGQDIAVDLELSDDAALAQYKLDVHHNFDCHSHSKRAAASDPWTFIAIREAEGKRLERKEILHVPADARSGYYHLMIRCLDASGNEAPYVELNLRIRNTVDTAAPRLILDPWPGDSITLLKSDSLILAGSLEDNLNLEGGRVELSYSDSAGTVFTINRISAREGSGSSLPFRFAYRFPAFVSPGRYRLLLEGFDALNNTVRKILWLDLIGA